MAVTRFRALAQELFGAKDEYTAQYPDCIFGMSAPTSRFLVKKTVQVFSVIFVFPLAAIAGFGGFSVGFQISGQCLALVPGLLGDFLRVAYYYLTLGECSLNSRLSFGGFFAQSDSSVGEGAYIAAYCVMGACEIGERTQIASHVQVLSGRHQHARTADRQLMGAREEEFQRVSIGPDCWIGASAIVMADVAAGATVGAGAVVTRLAPRGVTVAGNPARVVEGVGT